MRDGGVETWRGRGRGWRGGKAGGRVIKGEREGDVGE